MELLERYYQTLNQRDWKGFASTLAPNIVYEVPQTRERVRGQTQYVDFNATFPGNWYIQVVRLVADPKGGCGLIHFVEGRESQTGISFFTIEMGLITHILDYWPEPYEPPKRLSKFVERY